MVGRGKWDRLYLARWLDVDVEALALFCVVSAYVWRVPLVLRKALLLIDISKLC